MNSALRDLIRENAGRRKSIIPHSSRLLERVFRLHLGYVYLVEGGSGEGATALALEMVESFQRSEIPVVYCDIGGGIFAHRLHGLDHSLLAVTHPESFEQLMEMVVDSARNGQGFAWIIDAANLVKTKRKGVWELASDAPELVKRIRAIDPSSTVIVTRKRPRKARPHESRYWNAKIEINTVRGDFVDDLKVGHLLDVTGHLGTSRVYVEYGRGRLSNAWEIAQLEMESGKRSNDVFTDGDTTARGYWSFVHQANRKLFEQADAQRLDV